MLEFNDECEGISPCEPMPWSDISNQCYGDMNILRDELPAELVTCMALADDPLQSALSILNKADVRNDSNTIKATLPEKTYLTVDQPGLKQLYFAKEVKFDASVTNDRIRLTNVSGIQGRPPYAPGVGWVSIREIEVDRSEARIICSKLGAKFTIKIPMESGAFDEAKELLKKYGVR